MLTLLFWLFFGPILIFVGFNIINMLAVLLLYFVSNVVSKYFYVIALLLGMIIVYGK